MAFGDDRIAVQMALLGAKEFASGAEAAAESLRMVEGSTAEAGVAAEVAGSRFTMFAEKIGLSATKSRMAIPLIGELKHAFGGLMAVFIGFEAIHSSIEVTENLTTVAQKLADQYGMTTQAALKWSSATQILGIEPRSLMMGMTSLSNQLRKAREGSDLQNRALSRLGLSIEEVDSKGLDLGDVMRLVTKRYSEVSEAATTSAEKQNAVSAATVLLGRGYQTLGPIMMDHGRMFDRMQESLDRYFRGKNLSEMEKMRMAQVDYKTALFELQITLAEEVIPALIKAMHAMADFVDEGEKGHGVAGLLVDGYKALGFVIETVYDFFDEHRTTWKVLSYSILGTWAALKLVKIGFAVFGMGSTLINGVGMGIRFLQWNFAALGLTMDLLPFVAIITAAFALGAGLEILVLKFGGWHKVLQDIWDWVKGNWPLLTAMILAPLTGGMSLAVEGIRENWGTIESFIQGAPDRLKGFLGKWIEEIAADFELALVGMAMAFVKFERDLINSPKDASKQVTGSIMHRVIDADRSLNDHTWGIPHTIISGLVGETAADALMPRHHKAAQLQTAAIEPMNWGAVNDNMAGGGVTIHSHVHLNDREVGESLTTWRKNQAARR